MTSTYLSCVLQQHSDIFINPTAYYKRFYKYLVNTKLRAMRHTRRFIYKVTRCHTQLKGDEITEDLSVCDSSEPNLKNFCGKRRRKPRRTMLRQRD